MTDSLKWLWIKFDLLNYELQPQTKANTEFSHLWSNSHSTFFFFKEYTPSFQQ